MIAFYPPPPPPPPFHACIMECMIMLTIHCADTSVLKMPENKNIHIASNNQKTAPLSNRFYWAIIIVSKTCSEII